jgi:hypothetical protein
MVCIPGICGSFPSRIKSLKRQSGMFAYRKGMMFVQMRDIPPLYLAWSWKVIPSITISGFCKSVGTGCPEIWLYMSILRLRPKFAAVIQVIAHGELLVEPWSASSFDQELRMSVANEAGIT